MNWPNTKIGYTDRVAAKIVEFIRQNPSCSTARVMGEFDLPERTVHTALAYARRVKGIPVASIRFGSRGYETYYELRETWPPNEGPDANE